MAKLGKKKKTTADPDLFEEVGVEELNSDDDNFVVDDDGAGYAVDLGTTEGMLKYHAKAEKQLKESYGLNSAYSVMNAFDST